MQDRVKINEKSLNQFQNVLRQIARLRLKQGQKINLSKTKKMQEALRNIFGSKIKHFKKKGWSTKKCTCKCTKKKEIILKRLKENSKNTESFRKRI